MTCKCLPQHNLYMLPFQIDIQKSPHNVMPINHHIDRQDVVESNVLKAVSTLLSLSGALLPSAIPCCHSILVASSSSLPADCCDEAIISQH